MIISSPREEIRSGLGRMEVNSSDDVEDWSTCSPRAGCRIRLTLIYLWILHPTLFDDSTYGLAIWRRGLVIPPCFSGPGPENRESPALREGLSENHHEVSSLRWSRSPDRDARQNVAFSVDLFPASEPWSILALAGRRNSFIYWFSINKTALLADHLLDVEEMIWLIIVNIV